jgi:hypothetical protein
MPVIILHRDSPNNLGTKSPAERSGCILPCVCSAFHLPSTPFAPARVRRELTLYCLYQVHNFGHSSVKSSETLFKRNSRENKATQLRIRYLFTIFTISLLSLNQQIRVLCVNRGAFNKHYYKPILRSELCTK